MRPAGAIALAALAASTLAPPGAVHAGPTDPAASGTAAAASAGGANGGAPAAVHPPGVVADPSCGVFRVPLQPSTVVYSLPRGFIRAGSDTVRSAGRAWRHGADYTIDLLRGEIRLLHPPAAGETLMVSACWLLEPPPLTVQLVPYRAPINASGSTAAPDTGGGVTRPFRPATARDPARAESGTSLTLTGNKTLAIDFGSRQDAFLRQSLDLALTGTLAPGVELTGVLSDRNTPLTAGGTTQDLQSLDRVLIELTAPHGSAALGDIPLAWTDGEFGRLERRLQGVRGMWNFGEFQAMGAAATQQGEFRRIQLFGIDGQQGPYLLTDREGGDGVPVVAGSEVVTMDGARLARGESADYAIDYERGRITFTNRRPITSETRITIDYQIAATRFRRNLAALGGGGQRGDLRWWTRAIEESDDRGRPLDTVLSAEDRFQLALIGDSTALAIGPGVTGGGGDYDTVRAGGALVYAYAGRDSGSFTVQFAQVGAGRGDYADSALADSRTAYRFVGPGQGSFRVGRALPLPESHQVWTTGAEAKHGGFTVSAEGALSKHDLNTFSPRDDGDNLGGAMRAHVALETPTRGALAGTLGWALDARVVERRFEPFSPLEQPFAEESWGLPIGSDLEHQRRAEFAAYFRPRAGGELRASVGRLATASGYTALRREASWAREGFIRSRATLERADGTQDGARFRDGGRERARAELGLAGRWLVPAIHGEWDQRTSPSDTGRVGARVQEGGVELGSGRGVPWRAAAALSRRHAARATPGGFSGASDATALSFSLDSPAERRVTLALAFQRHDLEPVGFGTRSRSDLGSVHLRAERASGARAIAGIEVTSEGESRRTRQLVFVGAGRGAYDAFGNFTGTGDYDLVVSVSPGFDRIARAATSAHITVPFGKTERWRGSRFEFDFETDTRRRGDLEIGDPLISPRAARTDAGLARGSVLQRASADLAPGSAANAVFVRLERRVTSDRAFANFAQVVDERGASARWRTHPGPLMSVELELRTRRREAEQSFAGGGAYQRALEEGGGTLQLAFTPGPKLRASGAADATWSRPEGGSVLTRQVRIGPDLGASVGARGRIEAGFRRSFTGGPAPLDLLPTADPLGSQRWEGNARLDWRVHDGATFGTSVTARDRTGRKTQFTGRAELKAFF